MPRDGSGVYSKPAGTTATPNTTIESAKYNATVDDLVVDANAARPVTAGGTGRTTARLLDGTWRFENTADPTKVVALDLSPLTTATTRTLTVPDESGRVALQPHLAGHLFGLTLSNNVTDATNDIDIAAGSAIDSTNVHVMTLAAGITKRLDAAWAVGTGNGGLDTGAIGNNVYHMFLIKRLDTGVVDVLFSLSAGPPTMPANYTIYRRIGTIRRPAGAIQAFGQNGDVFLLAVPVNDVLTSNPGTVGVTVALSVPTGIIVEAIINGQLSDNTPAISTAALFSAVALSDVVPSNGIQNLLINAQGAGVPGASVGEFRVRTNTSGQIRYRLSASDADIAIVIGTKGWVDTRGRI